MARRLSERLAGLRPTAVNVILADVREVQAGGASIVSLMRGEPDFRTAPHIAEAAAKSLADGRTSYADNRGERRLRDAVSAKLARDNGVVYDPQTEVLVTTGATFGIYAALAALLSEGDEVLVPDPIYDAYRSPILLAGGRVRTVCAAIENSRFTLRPEAIEAAITPTSRVLLLNTPWNPVGTVVTRAELEAIGDIVLRHDLMLISDEIYEAIVYDGHCHVSPASLSPELRDRCVIVNSLSKTYAMTGWRVGYCAAPEPVIAAMFLILQQSSRGPATFIQDAAAVALTASQECVADTRKEYARRRRQVGDTLAGIDRARPLLPEGGFFAMVDVRATGQTSDAIRRRLLREQGVVVAHGSAYGEAGEGTLRVSFATGGDTLASGLERLRTGLEAL
jgi:aspartate/methionine/tyrosine aminotransferase